MPAPALATPPCSPFLLLTSAWPRHRRQAVQVPALRRPVRAEVCTLFHFPFFIDPWLGRASGAQLANPTPSDLLSRHVNKCHAAEKALLSSGSGSSAAALNSLGGGGRRKGTTAATRATTSKQACDQPSVGALHPLSCLPLYPFGVPRPPGFLPFSLRSSFFPFLSCLFFSSYLLSCRVPRPDAARRRASRVRPGWRALLPRVSVRRRRGAGWRWDARAGGGGGEARAWAWAWVRTVAAAAAGRHFIFGPGYFALGAAFDLSILRPFDCDLAWTLLVFLAFALILPPQFKFTFTDTLSHHSKMRHPQNTLHLRQVPPPDRPRRARAPVLALRLHPALRAPSVLVRLLFRAPVALLVVAVGGSDVGRDRGCGRRRRGRRAVFVRAAAGGGAGGMAGSGGGGGRRRGVERGEPDERVCGWFERREREGLPYSYAPSGPFSYAPGAGAGEFEYADSEHSGHSASASGGSRPASSAGGFARYCLRPSNPPAISMVMSFSSSDTDVDLCGVLLPLPCVSSIPFPLPLMTTMLTRFSFSRTTPPTSPTDMGGTPPRSTCTTCATTPPRLTTCTTTAPPEFSSAFGLMSLDDPNVLAGLATDGVPFFSGTTGTGRTGLTPGAGPSLPPLHAADGGARRSSMQLVPPQALAYQAYSPPSSSHSHSSHSHSQSSHSSHLPHQGQGQEPPQAQTPGTREAETRELREFWKAYMRTPLTGPPGDALGLQTPSANAGAGLGAGGMLGTPTAGRRTRNHPSQQQQQQQQQQGQQGAPTARTMHNADDLRSYEAAVLARKAPELVLRKPTRRPAPPPPPPPIFEFGRRRGSAGGALEGAAAGASQGQSQSSSLAGAFGFGQGPFPGTPTSASASASASEDGDEGEGSEGGSRPSFKRLPSQTLGAARDEAEEGEGWGSVWGGFVGAVDDCRGGSGKGRGRRRKEGGGGDTECEYVPGPPDDCAQGAAGGGPLQAPREEAERPCVANCAGVWD
ncbi:hypothetical protein B0H14DRAFT_2585992 [Mycena olivaceomarginata]|nr:hypothetical protein B0H14DRAFT_2585992 [Mycena olivaceomarginata]